MTEHLRVPNCHVREYLAVEVDPREAQRGHEAAVGDPRVTRGRVDPRDPERTELTFACTAGPVGLAQGVHRGLAGGSTELVLRGPPTLGLREQLLVLLVSGNSALDPGHPLAPYLQVRQQFAHELQVALGDECLAGVTALSRGGLVLVQLAFVRLRTTEAAGPGELQALLSPARTLVSRHPEGRPVLMHLDCPS